MKKGREYRVKTQWSQVQVINIALVTLRVSTLYM